MIPRATSAQHGVGQLARGGEDQAPGLSMSTAMVGSWRPPAPSACPDGSYLSASRRRRSGSSTRQRYALPLHHLVAAPCAASHTGQVSSSLAMSIEDARAFPGPVAAPTIAAPVAVTARDPHSVGEETGRSSQAASAVKKRSEAATAVAADEQRFGLIERAIGELREEAAALRDCLEQAGVVSSHTFQAQVHRRRFEAARQRHPCTLDASLPQVLHGGGAEIAIANFVGLPSVSCLRHASRNVANGLEEAVSALRNAATSRVYVCGGFGASEHVLNSAERYSPELGLWEPLPPMENQRTYASAAVIHGCLYVCGGINADWEVLRSCERFSPAAGVWQTLQPMSVEREGASALVVSGRLYLCGGGDRLGEACNAVERYLPAADLWESVAPLAQAREHSSAEVLEGRLYMCGGRCEGKVLSSAEVFDPREGNGWEPLPPMLEGRWDATSAAIGGCLYLCGGCGTGHAELITVERFWAQDAVWEALPPMALPRCGASVAVMAGLLYVCGGVNEFNGALNAVECFDPVAGVWQSLPPMAQERRHASAAVVAGSLHVFGGGGDDGAVLSSAERLDLRAGVWEAVPQMLQRRVSAMAGVLWY